MSEIIDRLTLQLDQIKQSISQLSCNGFDVLAEENRLLADRNRDLKLDLQSYEDRFCRMGEALALLGKPENYFNTLPSEEIAGEKGKYFICVSFISVEDRRQEFIKTHGFSPESWNQRLDLGLIEDTEKNNWITYDALLFGR